MSELNFSSPWLDQLKTDRPHFKLAKDTNCDVAVVGAGIAGISTVYQLLKQTDMDVLLIEAGKIAHGATGRNAGQVVSYFERPFKEIVEEFGLPMAINGQASIEYAWEILESIMESCELKTPLYSCAGYTGFINMRQVVEHLEEFDLREKGGLETKPMLLRVGEDLMNQVPEHLRSYILEVPHSVILDMLVTDDGRFIAAATSKKGCMNSALFCEELIAWMVAHFPERLTVAEHLPVERVTLEKDFATLTTTGATVTAKKVILCTNGFENFEIKNNAGANIDPSFHTMIRGAIDYMAGYIDEPDQSAAAVSYYISNDATDSYPYLTRRPYEHEKHGRKSLVCIGFPERDLPDDAIYEPDRAPPADITEELDRTLRTLYRDTPPPAQRVFLWQGLMGYTPNLIRRIGFEPKNNVLLYNLGCNGVGILPSVYGGFRVAQLVKGIHLPPSIFDPKMGDK